MILNGQRATNEATAGLREDVAGLREDVTGLREDVAELRERMARLEGLFEGFTKRDSVQ